MKFIKNIIKRLKLFDFILIGLGIIGILVFALIFFRKTTFLEVTVKVGQNDGFDYASYIDKPATKAWFGSLFYKGMQEKDGLGRVQAEVKDVFVYDKEPSTESVYITTNLRVIYSKATNNYTYKGIPVLIGSKIKMNLGDVYTEGVITDIEGRGESKPKKKIVVEAQLRENNIVFQGTVGTKDYVADSVNIGDIVQDNNGNTILKVIGKRSIPAKQIVTTNDGRIVASDHPTRKDLYLTLEINALVINNQYFFLDDIPILIDYPIPVNTTTASIFPVVTKFVSQ